jgi:hypothetical protein
LVCDRYYVANELVRGQPRLGFIYDGLPDTPHVAVELRRTDNRIEMSLPWNDEYNPGHERWFMQNIMWGDDPDRTKHRYEVPEYIAFVDPGGPVALVGCRASGYRSNGVTGIGVGTVTVRFAVIGANDASRYASINGLRSEIEGLPTFFGVRSVTYDHETDDEGRLVEATIRLKAPPAIKLARYLNLELRPSYTSGPGDQPDETRVRDRTLLQTCVKNPRAWDAHLDVHFAVRDLLRASAWRQLNFISHSVTRDDDPLRMLDGSTRGRQWQPVETALTDLSPEPSKRKGLEFDLLFRFGDVGSKGMSRWIALHRDHPRIVQPVLRLLELREASIETHVAQLGMGLEALGLKVALDGKVAKRRAEQEPIETRVARVAQRLQNRLPFDGGEAAKEIAVAYNGVKHTNRDLPESEELFVAYRKGVQIFRTWVMAVTGVPVQRSKERLERDRLTRAVKVQ